MNTDGGFIFKLEVGRVVGIEKEEKRGVGSVLTDSCELNSCDT